jgi:uncharacterized membrane protein YkvA (DUF1232 family)
LNSIRRLKAVAARLKGELITLRLVAQDPRTPWYAKAFIVCVVAYALSPIDLIPDPIPILGYVDDLLLLPLGMYLALKMVPETVLSESRQKAATTNERLPRSYAAAMVVVLLWAVGIILLAVYFRTVLISRLENLIPLMSGGCLSGYSRDRCATVRRDGRSQAGRVGET